MSYLKAIWAWIGSRQAAWTTAILALWYLLLHLALEDT